MPKHEVYINDNGQVEFLDLETGEVFRKEISLQELADYVKVGNKWVPFDQVNKPIQYNPLLAKQIVDDILEGIGILQSCRNAGIEYGVYCNWKKKVSEFRDLINEARKDRAELYFEKIEEAVEEAGADADEVALARVRLDAYKHIAGTLDTRFNSKTTVDGKIGVVPISIETGIRRSGDMGYEEKDVSRGITEGQEKIAASESVVVHAVAIAPIGAPVSEEALDGKKDN